MPSQRRRGPQKRSYSLFLRDRAESQRRPPIVTRSQRPRGRSRPPPTLFTGTSSSSNLQINPTEYLQPIPVNGMLPYTQIFKVIMRSTSAASIIKELSARSECPRCVVITAPDRIRRERALAYLLKHFAKDSKPTTFTFSEQGRSNPTAFLQDLSEPSLFEPTRFGVIRSIESAKAADVEPISALLERGVEGAHLFIVGESLPNTPNFKKTLQAKATIIPFEALKGAELSRWVERELKQQEISHSGDDVVELLISVGNEDPEAINRLIEKLGLFTAGSTANAATLRALEPGRATASDFELAESLLGNNRAATETLLHQLLSQGSSPFMLVGLLTKTFVTLLRIRALVDRGLSHGDIKADLDISPWLLSKYLPLAKKFSRETLANNLRALMVADFRLKDRSLGPAAIFSSLAREISAG